MDEYGQKERLCICFQVCYALQRAQDLSCVQLFALTITVTVTVITHYTTTAADIQVEDLYA